jgi:hypothetical protein
MQLGRQGGHDSVAVDGLAEMGGEVRVEDLEGELGLATNDLHFRGERGGGRGATTASEGEEQRPVVIKVGAIDEGKSRTVGIQERAILNDELEALDGDMTQSQRVPNGIRLVAKDRCVVGDRRRGRGRGRRRRRRRRSRRRRKRRRRRRERGRRERRG